MTAPPQALSRGVVPLTLDGGGVALSALLREPDGAEPRATVVALHGAGTGAGYFDGQAHPDVSLLTLGADLGFTVLAVDRPGYGASAAALPEGQTLADQARTLQLALKDFTARHAGGAGILLLAHSFGGKLALASSALAPPERLLGLDISGCGHRYAVGPDEVADPLARRNRRLMWGRLGSYPPDTFRSSRSLVSPMPRRERRGAVRWQEEFAALAGRVRVPVRFTFGEHESWWRHDEEAVGDLAARLASAPRVVVDRQPDAGHNMSLGWAARAYHLRALAFLEECLPRAGGSRPAAGHGRR